MNERLREELMMMNSLDSELALSENSSARYVLRGSFHANGVQLHLNAINERTIAINERTIAEHKYNRSRNRHKPNMKLMHDRHEGYDSFLREIQNTFSDQNTVLSYRIVDGDTTANVESNLPNKRLNYLLPIDGPNNFVIKRQSTSEITVQDQHTNT
ncbi:hypothetical protein BGZ80_007994 [Entomortierella chlamydospora]|uniref:Uncharacterized protein n=1 Tax=Entomortierella chlamydospora TaxID=101097 RepID=A0A9P6T1D6_9FUNG|nr:hypothetical protein BGZ80_007994 [Entomortierella chlamydospora]